MFEYFLIDLMLRKLDVAIQMQQLAANQQQFVLNQQPLAVEHHGLVRFCIIMIIVVLILSSFIYALIYPFI